MQFDNNFAPPGAPSSLKSIIDFPSLCYSSANFVYAGYEQSFLPHLRYQVAGSRTVFLVRLEDATALAFLFSGRGGFLVFREGALAINGPVAQLSE